MRRGDQITIPAPYKTYNRLERVFVTMMKRIKYSLNILFLYSLSTEEMLISTLRNNVHSMFDLVGRGSCEMQSVFGRLDCMELMA